MQKKSFLLAVFFLIISAYNTYAYHFDLLYAGGDVAPSSDLDGINLSKEVDIDATITYKIESKQYLGNELWEYGVTPRATFFAGPYDVGGYALVKVVSDCPPGTSCSDTPLIYRSANIGFGVDSDFSDLPFEHSPLLWVNASSWVKDENYSGNDAWVEVSDHTAGYDYHEHAFAANGNAGDEYSLSVSLNVHFDDTTLYPFTFTSSENLEVGDDFSADIYGEVYVNASLSFVNNGNEECCPVPIPGSVFLLGFGLTGLVGLRRRQNK